MLARKAFQRMILGCLLALLGNAAARAQEEAILGEKIEAAMKTCAAAYVAHQITTHTDAVICASGPVTKAFQEAEFPDMDLVFQFESASLDGATKLDHGQSTEADFRAAIMQAILTMKSEEARRAQRRAQDQAAQQQAQFDRDQALEAQREAQTAAMVEQRQAERRAYFAHVQQQIDNSFDTQIQNNNAMIQSLQRLAPTQCQTSLMGSSFGNSFNGTANTICR